MFEYCHICSENPAVTQDGICSDCEEKYPLKRSVKLSAWQEGFQAGLKRGAEIARAHSDKQERGSLEGIGAIQIEQAILGEIEDD